MLFFAVFRGSYSHHLHPLSSCKAGKGGTFTAVTRGSTSEIPLQTTQMSRYLDQFEARNEFLILSTQFQGLRKDVMRGNNGALKGENIQHERQRAERVSKNQCVRKV
jgi:hypothetical protein